MSKFKANYQFLERGQYNLLPKIWAIFISFCSLIDESNFSFSSMFSEVSHHDRHYIKYKN